MPAQHRVQQDQAGLGRPLAADLAECDRVANRERDCSGTAGRRGVNIQAVTGPAGEHRGPHPPHRHRV
ncbi:hypothetical protein ABZX85_21310 [Streptomyces sp. NPDC004539]|uniref:hypothetical protein n=1 Tax=Streptomyces sp. NPDC004539 TaxID=3154280 RepID=UPI00339E971E